MENGRGIDTNELLAIIGEQQVQIRVLQQLLGQARANEHRPDNSTSTAAGTNGTGTSSALTGEISGSG